MDSYRTRGDTNLGYTGSTQTLGVKPLSSPTSVTKEGWKGRFGLVFICVLLLFVCIALAIVVILTHVRKTNDHCSSSSCLEVAGAIKKNLNESVDPCKDFFQYSCGGWIKNNPIPSSKTWFAVYRKLGDENNKKLLLLLLEDDNLPSGHAVRKAKDYFKSCMAEDQNDITAVPELKRLITRYGSWPLGNTTWNETAWSLAEVLMALQRDFSYMSPLFLLNIDVNPFNSSQHILKVYLSDVFSNNL